MTHFGIVYRLRDGQADAVPGDYANGRFEIDTTTSALPVGQSLSGISTTGMPVQVVIDTENHERDFGESQYRVHLVGGTKPDSAAAVLFWRGKASAHSVPLTSGTLDAIDVEVIQDRARKLHRLALTEEDSDVVPPHDTILFGDPLVHRLGDSGLEAVNYQVFFRHAGRQVDDRASAFFLYSPADHRIIFGGFGHPEWSPNASHVNQFFPEFAFTVDGDPHLYLLAEMSGPWESTGSWVVFDARAGKALTDSVESFGEVVDSNALRSNQAQHRVPRELNEGDLSIRALLWDPDTADARTVLGTPLVVRSYDERIDDEQLHLTDWQYPGLLLTFSANGHLRIARITGGTWQTNRGLRVGDPAEEVVALYGPPTDDTGTELLYQLPGDPRPSRLGMFVLLANGRVTTIAIGLIVNGD